MLYRRFNLRAFQYVLNSGLPTSERSNGYKGFRILSGPAMDLSGLNGDKTLVVKPSPSWRFIASSR
jgi:hypothetical protein